MQRRCPHAPAVGAGARDADAARNVVPELDGLGPTAVPNARWAAISSPRIRHGRYSRDSIGQGLYKLTSPEYDKQCAHHTGPQH
jgi:hypothetical protein